jgi:hypothetical protein
MMAKELASIIITLGAVVAAILLIVFGITTDNNALITSGVGIISFGFGAVIKELFPAIQTTVQAIRYARKITRLAKK